MRTPTRPALGQIADSDDDPVHDTDDTDDTNTTDKMAAQKSGIAIGINKGHKVTPRQPAARISATKGHASTRTTFVREIIHEVAGLAPYERRIIELIRNSQEKRARKLAKKKVSTRTRPSRCRTVMLTNSQLGSFGRAKAKVEAMTRVIAESRRVAGH